MGSVWSMLANSLRCKSCGQSSSPKRGEGKWEMLGKLPDASVAARCTACGSGLALYPWSSRLLPASDVDRLVELRRGASGD
jgi:hypothetical protein